MRGARRTGGTVEGWDHDLARQVGHVLREHGETRPVPILGGFMAEPTQAVLNGLYPRLGKLVEIHGRRGFCTRTF